MLSEKPTLYIIGGANGVDKTNSFYSDFPKECPFINADEISKQLKDKVANNANI
jgi:predicted ABC-type ATPase